MVQKLNRASALAYLKATMFFDDLKKDEAGLSGVVVAVLLILIAVLAIVALWGGLSEWLSDMWDKITGANGIGAIKSKTL